MTEINILRFNLQLSFSQHCVHPVFIFTQIILYDVVLENNIYTFTTCVNTVYHST